MTTSLFVIYSNFILMCEILLQCFIIMVLISFFNGRDHTTNYQAEVEVFLKITFHISVAEH